MQVKKISNTPSGHSGILEVSLSQQLIFDHILPCIEFGYLKMIPLDFFYLKLYNSLK